MNPVKSKPTRCRWLIAHLRQEWLTNVGLYSQKSNQRCYVGAIDTNYVSILLTTM